MNLFILGILLLVSLGFAADADMVSACEEACCEDAGGYWDGYSCSGADNTYYQCVSDCTEAMEFFSESCCCGSALILLVAGGAVFMQN